MAHRRLSGLHNPLDMGFLAVYCDTIPSRINKEDKHMNDQANLIHTVARIKVINRYFAALDQKQFDIATMRQFSQITQKYGYDCLFPRSI